MEVINVYVHLDGKDVIVMKVSLIKKIGKHSNRYLINLEIEITIPYLNRQSYFVLNSSDVIKYIDLTFTTESRYGLIFYTENKLTEFHLIISIRNKILELM